MPQSSLTIRTFRSSDAGQVIALYQSCFAEPPWYESFNPEELAAEFSEIASWPEATFLVAARHDKIVGGTIGFDLSRKTDVAALIPSEPESCFYLSELFVSQDMRKQGIAEALVRQRFISARERGYRRAIVRTSINQPIIRSIYERLGFCIIAKQEVESKKMNGRISTTSKDLRIILAGLIR